MTVLVAILLIILAVLILIEVGLVGFAMGMAKGEGFNKELVELNLRQNKQWYDFSGELIEMLRYDGEGICPCCGADMRERK